MRIQEHIDKISWSLADRVVMVFYGIVTIFQINAAAPEEFGLFFLLNSANTWIFVVCDAFALQSLIQFGMDKQNRRKTNTMSALFMVGISMGISTLIFLFRYPLSGVFSEPRLIEIGTLLPLYALVSMTRLYAVKIQYRYQNLRTIFIINLLHFGTMTAVTFYLIFRNGNLDFNDLVLVYFSGNILSTIFSMFVIRKELDFSLKGSLQSTRLVKFGLPMMLQAAFHSIPKQLDVFIIQYFFSTTVVGVYGSAKSLFRVFDEAANASYGLIYPTAVRKIQQNDKAELVSLITKATSFLLFSFAILFVILEAGLTELVISAFLPASYFDAVGQFNVLLLGALVYPFVILPLVIHAEGRPEIVLKFTLYSLIFSFAGFLISGLSGKPVLAPLGLVFYYYSFGIISFVYLKRRYGFPFKMIFRAVEDSRRFVNDKFFRNN